MGFFTRLVGGGPSEGDNFGDQTTGGSDSLTLEVRRELYIRLYRLVRHKSIIQNIEKRWASN